METIESWVESQEFQIQLDSQGKIIDYLDPNVKRENKPEERIRQKTVQILCKDYLYSKECIALEKSIQMGIEKKRADIIIYDSPSARVQNAQGQISLIIETKAPSEKEPDGQLISYICSTSAQGGFWTNGEKIVYYKRKDSNHVEEWVGIPRNGEPWDAIGKYKKSELIIPIDLKLSFKRCHNAIYRSGIDSEDLALDMTRILLAKHEDEESSDEICQFRMSQEEYKDPEKRKKACLRVRKLFDAVKNRYPDVFKSSEEITCSDDQLAIVITQLQPYSFLDSPNDVIGTAYEIYVASHLKGERGQDFTNRLVVSMMVALADPSDKSYILDPTCGSGGFLISSMNYIFKKIDMSNRGQNAKDVLKRSVVHQLFGIDISPKLVKIAKANMLLGKDGHGGIEWADSLNGTDKLSAKFKESCGFGKPHIILSNPPFGSSHDLRIKDKSTLSKFKIGHSWEVLEDGSVIYDDEKYKEGEGVPPELLYLEQYLKWIREDGLICVVMAKGQLDNREAYAIRKKILEESQLLAVINLHEDTFEPFCGSKASVLLFKKCNPSSDYRIFMAISNKIGQSSRGETLLKKDSNGEPIVVEGKLVLDEDLSAIASAYNDYKQGKLEESEFCFSIGVRDIDKTSLSFNPVHYLPKHNEALRKVITLCDGEDSTFIKMTLSDVADRIFNGPRFKRPYADDGVESGPTIRKYFTGTAITQLHSDNIKYLDESKCSKAQLKQLNELTIHKGYILISDSGTLGRVSYALKQHDGHVATNNLIRVVIKDENLRGYVYQFLRSEIGQSLMLKNAYGTNQEHLEPDVISDMIIPIPKDRKIIDEIGERVISSIASIEQSILSSNEAIQLWDNLICEE